MQQPANVRRRSRFTFGALALVGSLAFSGCSFGGGDPLAGDLTGGEGASATATADEGTASDGSGSDSAASSGAEAGTAAADGSEGSISQAGAQPAAADLADELVAAGFTADLDGCARRVLSEAGVEPIPETEDERVNAVGGLDDATQVTFTDCAQAIGGS